MSNSRKTFTRSMAAGAWVLLAPALLFLTAVILHAIQPQVFEPSHSAQSIVAWFGARRWTLDALLIASPLLVLVAGGASVLRAWRDDPELERGARATLKWARTHLAMLSLAAATFTAAGILTIVALHMLTD